ncbi:hypothetical protein STSP2_00718 [Anaerohalosphaera lusitana]|uniref:Type II secretion system protein G n=1 Tax=Anaerohalosphaera lusitana TaxID=1936003 RepID=A0A1U9NIZ9_9BACT|nr:hypothetical protein [Anaerohalosphaera lusitana]AQT67570.1 hypothetical protein STSP2_00718 [Anaerohalosphaera lusitana]
MFKIKPSRTDMIVTLLCCAVLLAAMGAMGRGSKHAKTIVCQSNLRKLGQIATLYAQENDGEGFNSWYGRVDDYTAKAESIMHCSETKELVVDRTNMYTMGHSRKPWVWTWSLSSYVTGTYGYNGWLYTRSSYSSNEEKYFKNTCSVEKPSLTPMFADAKWVSSTPFVDDCIYPQTDLSGYPNQFYSTKISYFMMDRHYGATNIVFSDGHAESVALEEMWSLYWHKQWKPKHNVKRTDGTPIYRANSCK